MENEKQVANQEAVQMVEVSMSVPAGLVTFTDALAGLVKAVKDAAANGVDAQDIAPLMAELIKDFAPMAANFNSILPAFKEHPLASAIVLANSFDKVLAK